MCSLKKVAANEYSILYDLMRESQVLTLYHPMFFNNPPNEMFSIGLPKLSMWN